MGVLVAIYGNKPEKLAQIIHDCQKIITSDVGAGFHPYDVRQIHATIVGLGNVKSSNSLSFAGQTIPRDVDGFLNYLRHDEKIPFQIKVGGFHKDDKSLLSRGLSLYERSFSFQAGKGVIIGWPFSLGETYSEVLDGIRKTALKFGFCHRYYQSSNDFDNDFYFRIGLYDSSVPDSARRAVEKKIRKYLSQAEPIVIDVTTSNLFIAITENETLSLDTTIVWPVSDLNLTADMLKTVSSK